MITPTILSKSLKKKAGAIMEKKYINKRSWSKLFTFLKSLENVYLMSEKSCKKFIRGVFWVLRTGAQWRELPRRYGKWNTVYHRFNEWSKKGIWQQLHALSIEDPDLEAVMLDATIVRAHACAAGYKKGLQEQEGLGRSKGGFTSKIHLKIDALGLPLQFINTPGQTNDITQAEALTRDVRDCYVIADKGYDSDAFRSALKQKNCAPVIPGRSNRTEPIEYDKDMYKDRYLVEDCISRIKQFRRAFTRFDKSMRNFVSFLSFVGALLWLL